MKNKALKVQKPCFDFAFIINLFLLIHLLVQIYSIYVIIIKLQGYMILQKMFFHIPIITYVIQNFKQAFSTPANHLSQSKAAALNLSDCKTAP